MISFEWCIFRSLYFHAYKERSRMHNPITHTSLNDIAPNSSLQVDYIFIFHSVGSCFPFLFRVVPFVSFHQNTSRERERESERSRGRNCSSKTSVAPENTSIGWLHTWFTYALLNSYECSLCAGVCARHRFPIPEQQRLRDSTWQKNSIFSFETFR